MPGYGQGKRQKQRGEQKTREEESRRREKRADEETSDFFFPRARDLGLKLTLLFLSRSPLTLTETQPRQSARRGLSPIDLLDRWPHFPAVARREAWMLFFMGVGVGGA